MKKGLLIMVLVLVMVLTLSLFSINKAEAYFGSNVTYNGLSGGYYTYGGLSGGYGGYGGLYGGLSTYGGLGFYGGGLYGMYGGSSAITGDIYGYSRYVSPYLPGIYQSYPDFRYGYPLGGFGTSGSYGSGYPFSGFGTSVGYGSGYPFSGFGTSVGYGSGYPFSGFGTSVGYGSGYPFSGFGTSVGYGFGYPFSGFGIFGGYGYGYPLGYSGTHWGLGLYDGGSIDEGFSDKDMDKVADSVDNAPNTFNPGQGDYDKDKIGDLADNCPIRSNRSQQDSDGDDMGDACEYDFGGGGIINLPSETGYYKPGEPILVKAEFQVNMGFPDYDGNTFTTINPERMVDFIMTDLQENPLDFRKCIVESPIVIANPDIPSRNSDIVRLPKGQSFEVEQDITEYYPWKFLDPGRGNKAEYLITAHWDCFIQDPHLNGNCSFCWDDNGKEVCECYDIGMVWVTADYVKITIVNPIFVQIDIKPDTYPNPFSLKSDDKIPVAILSTQGFDATKVDLETVSFASAGVEVKGKKNMPMPSKEDVNNDGLMDLLLHIETKDLNLTEGDQKAVLTAQIIDGVHIEGQDDFRIVP